MATKYRGMCRLGASDKPWHIQVASPGGYSIPLPIVEYESREVMPDRQKLPTEKQHKALSAVNTIEQGGSAYINPVKADACEDRFWLESVRANSWRMTEAGNRFL
jgi:hypothetical protein